LTDADVRHFVGERFRSESKRPLLVSLVSFGYKYGVPTDADLFGPDKYIETKPSCPAGGTYTLGSVREKPTCSIPDHVLE